jgi:hypothetical protein
MHGVLSVISIANCGGFLWSLAVPGGRIASFAHVFGCSCLGWTSSSLGVRILI